MVAVLSLSPACTIERSVPVSRFACGNGGPCAPDAAELPDAGPADDAEPALDVAPALDAEPEDTGPPDVGAPDGGLPASSCPSATPLPGGGRLIGDTTQQGDDTQPTCNSNLGARDVLWWFASPGHLDSLTLSTVGSDFDTVLYLYGDTCDEASVVACDDDSGVVNLSSRIELTDLPAAAYYAAVDGFDVAALGRYELEVRGVLRAAEPCDPLQPFLSCASGVCGPEAGGGYRCQPPKDCADGIDNDGDGVQDEDQASCVSPPIVSCPTDTTVAAGTSVSLVASASDDGRLVERRWSLVSSPTPLLPPPFEVDLADTATIALELAGEYIARFTAVDEGSQATSCQTRIVAATGGDLRVELFWTPPPRSAETDLDLHLLDPAAPAWFDPTLDCEPNTCTASLGWGDPGAADDPLHEGNVLLGRGPEVVRISSPVLGGAGYRVGAYFANDGTFGPAEAFVRVHCFGRIATEFGPVTLVRGSLGDLDGSNSFWKVADVVLDGGACTVSPLSVQGGPLIVTSSTARLER